MSVQVKGSGTIGGLDEGLVVSGIVTSSTQINVGSNIKLGNAGVVTATSFVGSGANLTSLPAQATIANNADNRVITGGSGVNLNGEANLTFDRSVLTNTGSTLIGNDIKSASDDFFVYSYKGGSDGQVRSGIQFDSTNQRMEFYTGTNERLRITSDGKIGINQTSPQTGLHINQDWVNSYGSISVEGSANVLVGLGLRSNGNYRASLIWRDGSSGNYLDIATYGAAYPILFRPNGTEKVRITGGGDLEMTGGTVSLKEHMIRVGNRTTSQINAGVSTSTGALTLDTTTNLLKYYANSQWATVKKQVNDGSTQTLAARSAKALLDDGITTSGVYWLDMHGAYTSGNAKLHYCLQDTSYNGGGWTLLYSMNHGNNFASGSNYSFALNVGSNPTSVNDFTASNFGYDRRSTFTPQANDQFLIRRSDNNDWKRFVVTTWSPTANSISDGWSCTQSTEGTNRGHPYYALGQMYDSSGNSVSGMVHFNGCALGGNCNSGGGDGDGFGDHVNWSSGYSPYNCWGGAFNGQGNGGSPLYWGQGNTLSQGGSLYVQMFYRRTGTQ